MLDVVSKTGNNNNNLALNIQNISQNMTQNDDKNNENASRRPRRETSGMEIEERKKRERGARRRENRKQR